MKWLFGIAAVMLLAHFYFTWGERKIRRAQQREQERLRPPGG